MSEEFGFDTFGETGDAQEDLWKIVIWLLAISDIQLENIANSRIDGVDPAVVDVWRKNFHMINKMRDTFSDIFDQCIGELNNQHKESGEETLLEKHEKLEMMAQMAEAARKGEFDV
jgi:hypothetical protein